MIGMEMIIVYMVMKLAGFEDPRVVEQGYETGIETN